MRANISSNITLHLKCNKILLTVIVVVVKQLNTTRHIVNTGPRSFCGKISAITTNGTPAKPIAVKSTSIENVTNGTNVPLVTSISILFR